MSSTANAEPNIPPNFPILPPGTSLAGDIQGTFGVVIIAIMISSFLMGILTLQLFTYYSSFPRDPVFQKTMVALIYLLDWAQFICITDFGWWYLVCNWGNVKALEIIRPTFGLFAAFGSLIIFLVQCLFLKRVCALNRRLRYLNIPIFILIGVQFAFGILGGSLGIKVKPFADISTKGFNASVVPVWLESSVAADTALTAALSYILHTNRSGVHRTDNLITKLIMYSVNTCLLTSITALLNLIFYYQQDVLQNTYLVFNMILCRFFSNSLLASYNRRSSLRSEEFSLSTITNASDGIFAHSSHITDIIIGSHSEYSPGQQSISIPIETEPNPSTSAEGNGAWEYELYPMGNMDPT